jgi:iron complex transport system ATP-binding protein
LSAAGQAVPRALLTLAGVSFGYSGRPVLRDISLAVHAGQMLCILGANGAGKSTLLRLCAGILPAQAGHIACAGRRIGGRGGMSRAAIARHIAYLPQDSGHTFPFTALEVVLMGRYAQARHSFETDADLQAAEAAMLLTDVLALRDRPLGELSGGERRRVLLAQALAQDTEVVLLDEPTAGLDPAHAIALGQTMATICTRGKALVFTTHDLNLAARFAPQAALIHQAALVLSGPTLEVLASAGPLLGVELHLGRLPSGVPFVVPT